MNNLHDKINLLLQKFIPYKDLSWKEHGEIFYRYYLFRWHWTIVLHHFHHAIDEQPCHDHPWDFVTFVLFGGYWENTPNGREWIGAGSIRRRPAEFVHEIACPTPSWSLVVMGPKRREWAKCKQLRPKEIG